MTTTTLHGRNHGHQRDLDAEILAARATLATQLEGLRADETVHGAAIAAFEVAIESASLDQRGVLCTQREHHFAARAAALAAIRDIEDWLAAHQAPGAPVDTCAVIAVQREVLRCHDTMHTAAIAALAGAIESAPTATRAALLGQRAKHVIARTRTRVAVQHSARALAGRANRLVGCVRRLPCKRASRRARQVARVATRATAGPDGGSGDDPAPRRRTTSAIGGAL